MIYNFSRIIGGGGGHPAPPHPFILQNCVFVEEYCQYDEYHFQLQVVIQDASQ